MASKGKGFRSSFQPGSTNVGLLPVCLDGDASGVPASGWRGSNGAASQLFANRSRMARVIRGYCDNTLIIRHRQYTYLKRDCTRMGSPELGFNRFKPQAILRVKARQAGASLRKEALRLTLSDLVELNIGHEKRHNFRIELSA